MVKTVGIFTFHYAMNYGAVLQAYALSKVCEEKGADVEIINYYSKNHERANNIIMDKKRGFLKSLIYGLLVLPNYLKIKVKKKKFDYFRETKLKLSPRYETPDELISSLPLKDIYITGSDQVFNLVSDNNIRVYYLSFGKPVGVRKIAYAPSFGTSVFDESLEKRVGKHLADFDILSCREKDGADFMKRITGRDVPTVLDPVFLLSVSEWQKLLEQPCQLLWNYNRYIFVYDLNGRDHLINLANKLKHSEKLPIVCLTTKKYRVKKYHVDKVIMNAGPEDFISYIKNATYVITDSFHGTAFSLIFEKRFITLNALPKASQRIKSLLEMLNLSHRFFELGDTDNVASVINRNDDYKKDLDTLISSSKKVLEKSLV